MAAYIIIARRSVFIRNVMTRNLSVSLRTSSDYDKNESDEDKFVHEENPSDQAMSLKSNNVKLTGFAKAFAKQVQAMKDRSEPLEESSVSFATLLKNSSHIHLGNPRGQLVVGKIFHIVGDDLYIDFGGKFHCVCRRPDENGEKYQRGTNVRLRLKDIELTDHFIGATRDISLLEADADLLGQQKL